MRSIISIVHSMYKHFKKSYSAMYRQRTNFVLENIKSQENILILGARDSFVKSIVEYTDNKLNYYLVDKHPPVLKKLNFTFSFSDLNECIPFSDNLFDCIISDQLIEHLSRPDSLLKEIKRVGKKDCTIIIGSENLSAWHNIIALIFTLHPFSDHYSEHIRVGNPFSIHHKQVIDDPYMRHFKVPTMRALKELLEYYDYNILKIKGFGHLLPFGSLYDKYHSIQFVIVSRLKKDNSSIENNV
ncbi:MAG: methyltransferase domain-containing protein [Desulfobacteraceae bacterium]|nr:MAG: methyltransferase domain-containing protein [Desulfobacteraceae bacterium]